MNDLRFAVFGAGFWARYQLAAWGEVPGARCVALCDPVREKAEALAGAMGIPAVYDDPQELLGREKLDFIDIISDVDSHAPLVYLAMKRGLAAICQKPMAPSLEIARDMVQMSRDAHVPFFIHENWRWQTPLRQLRRILDEGHIGRVFRARIQYSCSFPVFDNQPFLKELEQFILTDIGSHILDAARFLFGEASKLYCQTDRVHRDIQGEDVATVMMKMNDTTVTCEMSYASRLEQERFPETYVLVEAEKGSVELGPDYWIRLTDKSGTHAKRYPPPRYPWADPAYDLIHASMVPCLTHLLEALRSGRAARAAETDAADNLKTVELIYAAYDSAESGRVIDFS